MSAIVPRLLLVITRTFTQGAYVVPQPANAGGGIEPCHYPHFDALLARGCGRQHKALSLPTFFLFAPEAQRRLAGGETTGKPVIIAFAPWQGRRTGV